MQLSIDGSYAAQRFDSRLGITMDMEDSVGTGTPMQLRLGGAMTGRRTGDCRRPRIEQLPDGNGAAPVN